MMKAIGRIDWAWRMGIGMTEDDAHFGAPCGSIKGNCMTAYIEGGN
jgi:hypothetical protein